MSRTISEQEHWLKGTRPSRAVEKEATAVAGRPTMPKALKADPVAAAQWRYLVRLLTAQKKVTKLDGPQLELVCSTYSRWQALLADIRQHGEMVDVTYVGQGGTEYTKRVANPASKMATQLGNSYHALLKSIGATPVSREKARPAKPDPEKEPVDPDNPRGIKFV